MAKNKKCPEWLNNQVKVRDTILVEMARLNDLVRTYDDAIESKLNCLKLGVSSYGGQSIDYTNSDQKIINAFERGIHVFYDNALNAMGVTSPDQILNKIHNVLSE